MRVASLLVAGVAGLVACGNDDGGPRPDDLVVDCAIPTATFSAIHSNRLNTARCATAACHDAGSAEAGLNFEKTASEVRADIVNVTSMSEPPKVLVVPGQSGASYFFEKLTNPSVSGQFGRMPPSGALDDCEIAAFREWIDSGALDD